MIKLIKRLWCKHEWVQKTPHILQYDEPLLITNVCIKCGKIK